MLEPPTSSVFVTARSTACVSTSVAVLLERSTSVTPNGGVTVAVLLKVSADCIAYLGDHGVSDRGSRGEIHRVVNISAAAGREAGGAARFGRGEVSLVMSVGNTSVTLAPMTLLGPLLVTVTV